MPGRSFFTLPLVLGLLVAFSSGCVLDPDQAQIATHSAALNIVAPGGGGDGSGNYLPLPGESPLPPLSCEPFQVTILAGQYMEVGMVTVGNNETDLFILIEAYDGEYFDEAHVYAGLGLGPLEDDNPAPGQFPFKQENLDDATEVLFQIPLALLQAGCGDTLYVAVHVAMDSGETGWAYDPDDPDHSFHKKWGGYFLYTICCDQPPVEEGCTYTQGYWKNHPEAWPEVEGYEDYLLCGIGWLEILETPPRRGNAWYILAHQWIAAVLNVANGADDGDVEAEIDESADLLADSCTEIVGADRGRAIDLAELLDAYNNGEIGPGHCDDSADEDDDGNSDGDGDGGQPQGRRHRQPARTTRLQVD